MFLYLVLRSKYLLAFVCTFLLISNSHQTIRGKRARVVRTKVVRVLTDFFQRLSELIELEKHDKNHESFMK